MVNRPAAVSAACRIVASALGLMLLAYLAPPAHCQVSEGQASRYVGMSLADALRTLEDSGLKIVFTSEIVLSDMRVESEPTAIEPRAVLEELLAPHGLAVAEGPRDTLVVVRRPPQATPTPPADTGDEPAPEALPMIEEQLVVRPSRVSLLREEPIAPLGMTRDEILALPHLGDDFYRSLALLPGVISTDVSAQFHVRGGRRDETQILLDGQELFDAYHLKDFDSALSLVASSNLASADLTTGGYSAEYGDRMSGVLDMRTVTPSGPARGRLGASVFNAHVGGAGTFNEDRGVWMGEVRRGTIDFLADLLGNEDPVYWDAYAKVGYQLDERNNLRLNLLGSGDELTFSEVDEESSKRTVTRYDSRYAWATHRLFASDRLYFDTVASMVGIDRDRNGFEDDEDAEFEISDLRETELLSLRQDWSFEASERHFLRWGFGVRRWETEYDYSAVKAFESPFGEGKEPEEEEIVLFAEEFEEDHDSVYLIDRIQLAEPLSAELGLRYDSYSQTDEELLSPRINLGWVPRPDTAVRLAWGHFNQSQRSYELQVEDGETMFHPVEESVHTVIGVERILRSGPDGTLAVRLEAYHRAIDDPRPRYENLYEPINTFPEAEPDRVRIAPDESEAQGVEFFLRGRNGSRFGWFVNYAYAETEDLIEGVWVPRSYDQRHTVNLDLDFHLGRSWRLNLAWIFHTGWPTTPLSLGSEEDEEGETEYFPVLGPLNSKRLPDYHRLDMRASREWDLGSGVTLGFFVDIQNVYDQDNVAGFDVQLDAEEGELDIETEYWAGVIPSLGFTLEF